VAGGAGKTPLTIALAEHLLATGHRVAVLTRGYRGSGERGVAVIEAGLGAQADPAVHGDEPVLIARRVPRAHVVIGADRVRAALRAVDELGIDTLLLDDGFQHRRLHRDLDLVVLRAPHPLDNGRCLPAGMLREPATALRRAHALVINTTDGALAEALPASLRGDGPVLEVRGVVRQAVRHDDGAVVDASALRGRRVLLAAAVARPASVERALAALGAVIVHRELRRDHHAWRTDELLAVDRLARRLGAVVITTEKDAVKWHGEVAGAMSLRLELQPVDGAAALHRLLERAPGPP
jgi:tetraacyldisaccharide 4'-kinase